MKRAYVVAGPESSGNRALAALLMEAGCAGSTDFDHPWMHDELPAEEEAAVVIRSFPHGNDWPDIPHIFRILRDRGYCVRVLVTVRKVFDVIRSQINRRHHPAELAWRNYHEAYLRLFKQLAEVNVWYALVPFVPEMSTEDRAQLLAALELGA